MKIKKNLSKGLSGVGNKAFHQYIISDLIFGVRKKLVKDKKASKHSVLSEISLSQLGYETTKDHFSKDYNIDFVVINELNKNLLFIAEIERAGVTITGTLKKIQECLTQIPTIQEAYIISFDGAGKTSFELCTIQKKKLQRTKVNSKSEFLGLNIKSCLSSTKI
ncbi:MAG: hypothetical protein LC109_14220 [Bacteroidia bacterium]|nr:hypothetical protein [Bacteroidia bacterium]